MSPIGTGALLSIAWVAVSAPAMGEIRFNGLVGLSTDYILRGHTLTRGEPAPHAGAGLEHDSGAFAGIWMSRIDFSDRWERELEIDYVLGWAGALTRDWEAGFALRRYTYPRSRDALGFDYTELEGSARFRELASLTVSYAPGWSGYTRAGPVRGERLLTTELALQYPLGRGVSIVGGLGRFELSGAAGGAHLYWNGAIAFQRQRFTLELGFYDTDSAARRLFGPAAVQQDVAGGVVWQF